MHSHKLHSMRFTRRAYLRGGLLTGALMAGFAATGCGWSERRTGHWGGWRHGRWDEDPAAAKEHMQEAARWILGRIDATDEQEARIEQILAKLIDDVSPLVEKHRGNRTQMVSALTADTIDRAALNRLRDDDLELAGQAYHRFTDALADIADTLTPTQRTELVQVTQRFRRWH